MIEIYNSWYGGSGVTILKEIRVVPAAAFPGSRPPPPTAYSCFKLSNTRNLPTQASIQGQNDLKENIAFYIL